MKRDSGGLGYKASFRHSEGERLSDYDNFIVSLLGQHLAIEHWVNESPDEFAEYISRLREAESEARH
jgi:hypothetical protein